MKESEKAPSEEDKDKKDKEKENNDPDDKNEENRKENKKLEKTFQLMEKKMKELFKISSISLTDIEMIIKRNKEKSHSDNMDELYSHETRSWLPGTDIQNYIDSEEDDEEFDELTFLNQGICSEDSTGNDKDQINKEKERQNPDSTNEQNWNEKKKKKKKFKLLKKCKELAKSITPWLKDFWKYKKSDSKETPPSLTGINTPDHTDGEQTGEKTLLEETRKLIALWQVIYSGGSIDDERRNKMESFYTELEKKIFRVIEDSLSNEETSQLIDAIEAIVALQHEDQQQPQWPWKIRWRDIIVFSVAERLNKLITLSRNAPCSRISDVLGTVGKAMMKDLTHVIENLRPIYPEQFDVCNIYAQQYHHRIQCEINLFIKKELQFKEIHCLLSWIKTLYPSVLRTPALIAHINVDQLAELLPSRDICYLENMYIFYQQEKAKEFMTKSLQVEEKYWKKERKPEKTDSVIHSELAVDIREIYNSGIKAAKIISKEFIIRVTPILINEFQDFLNRYEESFENYCKENTENPYFMEIIIANINCCNDFRDFTKEVMAGVDTKQTIYSILMKIETHGYSILLQDFLQDIESGFRRISQTKGRNSQEIMSQIIATAREYMSAISTLVAPCHQVMADKIHTHLVNEYLTNIRYIGQCNTEEQGALAAQMHNTADLLTQFYTDYLNDAQKSEATRNIEEIRMIAEIIRLQDLEAIKLEITVLNHKYPDISKEHIEASLCIKKNLKKAERKKIFDISESRDPPKGQQSINKPSRLRRWFNAIFRLCQPCYSCISCKPK